VSDVLLGALAVLVFASVAAQTVTGMGFSLLLSPAFIVWFGPQSGVLLVNSFALAINIMLLTRLGWRGVYPQIFQIMLAALASIAATTWLLRYANPGALSVAAGVITVSCALALWVGLRVTWLTGRRGAAIVGTISGALNVSAGVAGPAVSMLAINNGWEQRRMVATLQVYFAVVNAVSVLAALTARGLPDVSGPSVAVLASALAAGLLSGPRLAALVPPGWTRPAILTLACAGGVGAVAKGLVLLWPPA
jgi:uncharacterized membrane protein YfcA